MGLHANDLIDLVEPVFEIDSYQSKMGNDSDIMVLSFTVLEKGAADDLVKFTKTEVQDVNVLSLISILEKTTIQAREMNAICGVKEDASSNEKSSWLYSSKRVHTKQCE